MKNGVMKGEGIAWINKFRLPPNKKEFVIAIKRGKTEPVIPVQNLFLDQLINRF